MDDEIEKKIVKEGNTVSMPVVAKVCKTSTPAVTLAQQFQNLEYKHKPSSGTHLQASTTLALGGEHNGKQQNLRTFCLITTYTCATVRSNCTQTITKLAVFI